MKNPEKFWDRISKNYDNSSKKGSGKPSKPLLATKPYLSTNGTLLDFGCATGKNALELSEFVKNIQGIDISEKMIEIARKKANEQNIENITFTKTDIFDSQLVTNSFDTIISFNVLHLLENLDLVIHRIYELLKPSGFFITNTPCLGEKNNILRALILIGSKLNLIPEVKMLKGSDLVTLLVKNNFEVLENRKLIVSDTNNYIVAKK